MVVSHTNCNKPERVKLRAFECCIKTNHDSVRKEETVESIRDNTKETA